MVEPVCSGDCSLCCVQAATSLLQPLSSIKLQVAHAVLEYLFIKKQPLLLITATDH